MANNVQQYHVFGEAIVSLGVGTANALVVACYSEAGARVTIQTKYRPIHTDVGGSEVPAEWQEMGAMAVIEIDAPVWTENYIRLANTRGFAQDGTTRLVDGVQGRRGQLVGTMGLAYPLAIAGGGTVAWEDPMYFPTAFCPDLAMNLGTENMKKKLRFTAWPFIPGTANTVTGINLFSRTVP